ncbi:MAG: DM13 domain-containing protein [Candidatus Moranbacteria bacterium]|nr:DM13 domain-containing protein [Candidatus Moranbacteria bacterium]
MPSSKGAPASLDRSVTDTLPQDVAEETISNRVAIIATPAHPGSGFVRIIRSGGKSFVRYEELQTINGPDIYVYLSKDFDAKEYVEIGRVRATEGNINYEIPENINPREYPYVLIWCKAFGVLFNSAKVY